MKIGIVTYWKSTNNYGEQLQNYALQAYLKDLGHEPFLIRYDYENDRIRRSLPKRLVRAINPKRLVRYFVSNRNNRKIIEDRSDHPRGFESFREEYLSMSREYSTFEELRNDPPEADMYICGSDQVWNSFSGGLFEMRNRLGVFFLNFGKDNVKRVSYAASWGRVSIPEEEKSFIQPLMAKFDAVSVREKSGIDICCRLGRTDAQLALDPVLLHSADKYRQLFALNEKHSSEDKYVFFYYMDNDGDYNRQAVFDWAASHNLKVIYVTDDWHDLYERSFPSVIEWLELIDNAEYVVTNSFHCSVFSIIFEKRFGVIKRFGVYTGMNTRMDSLFELCEMTPRYIDDVGFDVLNRPPERMESDKLNSVSFPEDIISIAMRK